MSSDLLGNAPYEFTQDNRTSKDGLTNIDCKMERLAIQHPSPHDDDEDNDIIGHLVYSPTHPTLSLSSDPATIIHDQQMQQRVQSPSKYIDSNWTTTTTTHITNEMTDTQTMNDGDDDDLQKVMQMTWNALDTALSNDDVKVKEMPKSALDTTQHDGKIHDTTTKQQYSRTQRQRIEPTTSVQAPSITTVRVYISDFKNFKTVQLTNMLTTAMVIQYLKRKELLDNDDDWTLFEIDTEHNIERPLRLWEIISDVTSCWEKSTTNTLLIKKYGLYKTLAMETLRNRPSLVHGWLNIEYKKDKWQKRYCFIKDHIIYHADNTKYSNSAMLCHLASFDVYTPLQPYSTSPTPFVFALKVQDKVTNYAKEQGYVRIFAAEDQSCLESWVLGIRQEKSMLHYRKNPKRVNNPLAVFKPSTANSSVLDQGSITRVQRHKSIKLERGPENADTGNIEEPKYVEPSVQRITDEIIKRRVSRRSIARSGSTRHLDRHPRASLCDTEGTNGIKTTSTTTTIATTAAATVATTKDEGSSGSTLIQIDDKFKFSKGSLLDKSNTFSSTPINTPSSTPLSPQQSSLNDVRPKLNRMSSARTTLSGDSLRQSTTSRLSHHASIRGKGYGGQNQEQDAPQLNTTATSGSSGGKSLSITSLTPGTTLLNLDHTPERFHTQTLLRRQLKPLLNFNQDITSTPRR